MTNRKKSDTQRSRSRSPESGETPTLEELQKELQKAVTAICPTWLADQQDELVEAAMVRVVELQETDKVSSTAHLWKAAYSALVDEIRRHRHRYPQEVALEDVETAELPVTRSSRALKDGIRDCLAKMARDRREAVTLKLQGHSVRGIANILGWSPKKAENSVYRGLKDLQGHLAFLIDDSGGWIALGPRYGERAFNGRPLGSRVVEDLSLDLEPGPSRARAKTDAVS